MRARKRWETVGNGVCAWGWEDVERVGRAARASFEVKEMSELVYCGMSRKKIDR